MDESKPYAEWWFGTHPNGPGFVKFEDENILVSELFKAKPDLLGDDFSSLRSVDGQLPYLLKVLSVEKALSIQAHPDPILARKLHSSFPKIYKDPNHKPEMAIALTNFESMCGFRAFTEIVGYTKSVPELRAVIGSSRKNNVIPRPIFIKKLISHNILYIYIMIKCSL